MPRKYWLFKSEPSEFSIDDLAASPNQEALWTGVRNYQARNLLRDEVKVGHELLFYHSSTEIPGIAGLATVVGAAEPDLSALDPSGLYYDRRTTKENPVWVAVKVRLTRRLPQVLPLAVLKQTSGLENMMVCQRGSRLSIQPVTSAEWRVIQKLMRE